MVQEGKWKENQGSREEITPRRKEWPTLSNATESPIKEGLESKCPFYLTTGRLTFARTASMEWRDWEPDCSGLKSE